MGAQYFLGRELIGQTKKPAYWNDHDPPHIAFMCNTCGEVWGRVINTARQAYWCCLMQPCSKHGGGSFIASFRDTFEELPPEVLHYELMLRLDKEPPCLPPSSSVS